MKSFKWTRDYALYVAELDAEHKAVFGALNGLAQLRSAELPVAKIQELFSDFFGHATKHFAHEERLMRATFYRSYTWHKRQHDTARNRIAALEPGLSNGDRTAVLELLDFLAEWLEHHIRVTDRMMSAYMQNYWCANPMARAS